MGHSKPKYSEEPVMNATQGGAIMRFETFNRGTSVVCHHTGPGFLVKDTHICDAIETKSDRSFKLVESRPINL